MLDRQGYTLLEAGTPDKLTVKLDVAELWRIYGGEG